MDFGARFYDPRVGRFISPDPIRDVSSANAVNPYVYCMNNPLRYTDKFGLRPAQAPQTPPEEGGGGGGGDYGGQFGWDKLEPIPFSAYPVYYGASINGRQAWIYSNEVKFRAKQEAKEFMLAYQIDFYNATMAAVNALIDSLGNKSFQDTIEALTTYTADAAGAGALIASYDAAMAASEGGFVADASAVSGSAADDIGSAYEGEGTGEGVRSESYDRVRAHVGEPELKYEEIPMSWQERSARVWAGAQIIVAGCSVGEIGGIALRFGIVAAGQTYGTSLVAGGIVAVANYAVGTYLIYQGFQIATEHPYRVRYSYDRFDNK